MLINRKKRMEGGYGNFREMDKARDCFNANEWGVGEVIMCE